MSDDPRMVEQAAREAYELGILKEEDMDRSIRCMMETKLRLGVYDRENLNPYDHVTEDNIDSPKAREIFKELSRESIVLLKNENGALPLDKALKAEDIAIVGPLGDAWYQDWYGGTARHTAQAFPAGDGGRAEAGEHYIRGWSGSRCFPL